MYRFKKINHTHLIVGFARPLIAMYMGIILMCLFVDIAIAEHTPIDIGNPLLTRFPNSGDPENALPRTIWDMHYFNNRIYIAHGDHWHDKGPIDIWIYDGNNFEIEYTVDEEIVLNFFEFENKLFIPGNDPHWETDDHSLGNLYINDPNRYPNPGWIKLRTLPYVLHSYDVALFKGILYQNCSYGGSGGVLMSDDMGQTWKSFYDVLSYFLVFDDFMLIASFGTEEDVYKYDGVTMQKMEVAQKNALLFSIGGSRRVRFGDGFLCSNAIHPIVLRPNPLFYITKIEHNDANDINDVNDISAMIIDKFNGQNIQDIVVRDTSCYVMTAEEITQDVAYKGCIYSSTDLINWLLVTEFTLPGIPVSFEIMNNRFYIGLGCRGVSSQVCIGSESGSIWEIVADPWPLKARDPSPTDGTTIGNKSPLLSWTPGYNATEHDVYFGINLDDVSNADTFDNTGIYRGRWLDANYTTEELDPNQTYYWRIDEVNDLELDIPWKGDVWSFTISDEVTVEFQVSSCEDDGYGDV